jgi:hypothetical protein
MLWIYNIGTTACIQISSVTLPVYNTSTLVNGLCAFYNFDGNFNDSSGNGINLGTGGSCAYNYTTGVAGTAIQFTNYGTCGSSSGVVYPYDIWNVYNGQSASFSIWFKYTQDIQFTGGCSYVFFGGVYSKFGFNVQPTTIKNQISYGISNVYQTTDPTLVTVGQWNHIVGTFNSSTNALKIYRNGTLINSVSGLSMNAPGQGWTGFAINGSNNQAANSTSTAGEYGIPIVFDATGLWNRVLSDSEIAALYNNGAGLEYPFTVNIQYLLVGGGGSGGSWGGAHAGGGGAGGVVAGTFSLTPRTTYSVVVGSGGNQGTGNDTVLNNGRNTLALGLTAYGGGHGGAGGGDGIGSRPADSGGSGGGGFGDVGGAGTLTQGFSGGTGLGTGWNVLGGGGGGAGAPGSTGGTNVAVANGAGGIGVPNPIAGSIVGQLSAGRYWVAGGGSGIGFASGSPTVYVSGGLGGGGIGGMVLNSDPVISAGTPNTGGGGAGGGLTGGSGVVVFSIPTAVYTGITTGSPVITTYNNNTIITFLSSGSYTA